MCTPFGTFLLRQFMLTIPSSLDEAAEIDGASKWQVFWDVILPLARPGLIVLCIFTFMGTYNSFFWPLVMLRTQAKYTLPARRDQGVGRLPPRPRSTAPPAARWAVDRGCSRAYHTRHVLSQVLEKENGSCGTSWGR